MNTMIRRFAALLVSIILMISAIPLTAAEQAEEMNDTEETEVEISEEYTPDDTADIDAAQESNTPVQEEAITFPESIPEESDDSDDMEWPEDDDDEDTFDLGDEDWYQDYIDEPEELPEDEGWPTFDDVELFDEPEPENPTAKPSAVSRPELSLQEYVGEYYDGNMLKYMIYEHKHAYVITESPLKVYRRADQKEEDWFFTLTEPGTVLLCTEYGEIWNYIGIKVWFIAPTMELISGYVNMRELPETVISEEEAYEMIAERDYAWIDTDEEEGLIAFVAAGEKVTAQPAVTQEIVEEPIITEKPSVQETSAEPVIVEEPEITEVPASESDSPEIPEEPEEIVIEAEDTDPVGEEPAENPADGLSVEPTAEPAEILVDEPETEVPAEEPEVPEETELSEEPDEEPTDEPAEDRMEISDYLLVTKDTRVFLETSEESCAGNFVNDATVQIADIIENKEGIWYCVYYMFGDTLVDGSVKWTEIGTVYILADEAKPTDSEELTMTDYALTAVPTKRSLLRSAAKGASTTPMNGFSLKTINVQLPTLYAGQTGVYGSSGKDSDYPQIASLAGKGAIYATPHYLDGFTVYCLEHTYDGPGEGSGSNQTPKGPYAIVDIDTYLNTPGQSGIIFSDATMHAIAWVLRHTYPFMALDRSDSNNLTWSRVAGQFAIRQVIREMEGAQYVRDYWNMDNFYVASGQAPSVYLEYARWLATNGIARGNITGSITVSNKSVTRSGESYVGTVTLSTDADLIRIPKGSYTITGNSAGSDSSYYFLNSGDTIQITSSTNGFSITAESVNSDAEEASFLVGVPSANIQKVLIPVQGYPYKMQAVSADFEVVIQYGDLTVTKRRDRGDQRVLAGASFQLYNSSNQAVGSPVTTDSDGVAKWTHLEYGTYYLKETAAPAGYVLNSSTVTVSINSPTVTYTAKNTPIIGSVKVIKKENSKNIPLVGAKYELVTKSGSTYTRAVSVVDGSQLPVLTTDRNGETMWQNVVEQGDYYVHEVQAPEGYVIDNGYYAVKVSSNNTIVSKDVTDPIITGKIKIVKKDQLTKEPLAGAEFTITRLSAPASYNGSGVGEVVAVITTDANGCAETGWLTYGKYKVEETKVPPHFVNNHFSTVIEAYENGKTYTVTVENEPAKGWIRITKKDALDEHTISGVQFDIYQNGRVVSTMTTNENGVATSEPLNKGKYTIKEHDNPQGYTAELYTTDCSVKSDETTELTAENTPIRFRVKIIKKDQLTKEPLAGAEFKIIRKKGLPSHGTEGVGDTVATLVTDQNGEAVSELLTWGEYEVKETKVPVHFVDNHYTITVSGTENNKTYTITVENEPTKGYIKLVKTDKLDRTPIEGVQFDIYYNDQYGSGLAGTMTTNTDGVAVSPALRKGKYIVKEHADPTGYVTELLEFDPVVVKSDETTNISGTNMPIQGRIRIIKKDQLTKEALTGAEFTVTRISGLPSHKGSNNGEVVAVITTDAEGIAVTPLLTWGTYKVEETKVPVHFVDNHYSTEVVIDTDNLKTYEIEVENEPTKGWIRLTKKDRKNGNGIAGVQFDIYYNDQYGEGLATTMVTDENGIAMSEPIRKGKYIVKEHGATAGYVFEEVTINCTVKSDEITDVSATNLPVQVKLRLYKRDKDEYTGNPEDTPGTRGDGVLTGAVFQIIAGENITDRQGNILYRKGEVVVASLKTAGADASVITDELWPGVYELVELTPPTGYQASDMHVRIDATSAANQSTEAVVTYIGVKTNEILYGKYGFVKFLGDNEIHDEAGLIEEAEPGAVFEIYLRSAGSYDAARKFERDKITTDKYGKAETKLLPYGVYTVKQTKAKAGYAIKAPFDIFITGTEDPSDPPSLIINNEAVRYRLKFIKVDAETGRTVTVANTAFKLKDANGDYVTQTVHYPNKKEIDTFYTGEDGTVMLPEAVRRGLYFIEEFKAPEGYLIQTEELAVFVGDENMNEPGEAYLLEFRMEDTPVKGRIILEKTGLQLTGFREKEDRYGNTINQPIYEEKRLEGAVFEIHAAEDIIGKDGTEWYRQDELVEVITTTAAGEDASGELPLGKYYLIEVSAPEGYVFPDTRYEAELVYADDHTPLVEVTVKAGNDFIPGEIRLLKEKEITSIQQDGNLIRQVIVNTPGEGFTFGLYNDMDIHYANGTLLADSLIAEGRTDADGILVFEGNFPHGRYYIRELAAPEGWKLNIGTFTVELNPRNRSQDQKIFFALPEKVHDELIWYPITLTKTDITGEHTIPGALIEVTNDKGEVIYRAETDQNGEIPNIPVVPGKYTFREILAPSGYALNEAVMTFVVDQGGGITGDTVIRDDYTRVTLLKHDENGLPLAGVEFALIRADGKVIMTARSDPDGRVLFEKIPYGSYTIEETKTLAGYQKHDVSIELKVDGTFINQEKPLDTIINTPIVVKLKKVDQDGNVLPGAEYALINEFGEQVMTAVSDANGILTFEKVPYGKYSVKELSAPEGYLLSKTISELVIDDTYRNSEEPVLTLVNHLKRLKYIKVDTSGKFLPGVEFSLINASTGEVAEVVTSNEKGEFIFTKFDYGFWKIKETKVPEGFSKMKDITLNVDSDWVEPAPFTCINIPNVYEFVKADNEGNPMVGVKFNLEDTEGNVLRKLVSGENGLVTVDDLEPGTYIIRETETLEGYTVSGETIEIVIDENYVVAVELPVFVNYPDIQTGVDFEITPVMYAGGAVMLIGIIALIASVIQNRKSRKKRARR